MCVAGSIRLKKIIPAFLPIAEDNICPDIAPHLKACVVHYYVFLDYPVVPSRGKLLIRPSDYCVSLEGKVSYASLEGEAAYSTI